MKRVIILFTVILGIVTCLCGCGKENNSAGTGQEIVNAFASQDMPAIEEILFGTKKQESNNTELVESILGTSGDTDDAQSGVLRDIFSNVSIEVSNTTDDTVEYTISAPDMKNVFINLMNQSDDITSDELRQYIADYATKAPKIESKVSLAYVSTGEEFTVDYRNEEFINAVTGGLLQAYKTLYLQMIEEYQNGGN